MSIEIDGHPVGSIMTVRGPMAAGDLGPTMMHEHLFVDVRGRWSAADSAVPDAATRSFDASVAGAARWSSHVVRDNLAFDAADDYAMIRDEVAAFVRAAGRGACLVDLTPAGIHPSPERLGQLADELDLPIVMGAGFYVHSTHPEFVETASVDDLTAYIVDEIAVGRDGTARRSGIIGEIGTSEELYPCEERVLRAAAQASTSTGIAINVHCHPGTREVTHGILDILASASADLERVYLSHLDEIADLDYLRSVLDRGVVVGFDSFGQEGYFAPSWRALSDLEKAQNLVALAGEGYADQLVVAQDVCKKQHLTQFGGMGYDHVVARVIPRMQQVLGLGDDVVDTILVATPRRLLARVEGR